MIYVSNLAISFRHKKHISQLNAKKIYVCLESYLRNLFMDFFNKTLLLSFPRLEGGILWEQNNIIEFDASQFMGSRLWSLETPIWSL